jgi:hypothetical protein
MRMTAYAYNTNAYKINPHKHYCIYSPAHHTLTLLYSPTISNMPANLISNSKGHV